MITILISHFEGGFRGMIIFLISHFEGGFRGMITFENIINNIQQNSHLFTGLLWS